MKNSQKIVESGLHYLFLIFGIICIGWSAIFVKLSAVPPLSSAFYRMLIGLIGCIPVVLLKRKRAVYDARSLQIAVLCGILFACDIAFWNTSIMLSKAAISTLLGNLAPVWVGLGAMIWMKSRLNYLFWLGTAIALFGVALIIGLDTLTSSKLNLGHFLAITASLFYAAYLLIMRKGRLNMDTITFTMVSMASSSAVLLVVALVSGTQMAGFSISSWGALLGLGLISQLGGWLAINYAMGYISAPIASASLLAQSAVTALIALPVLNEKLGLSEAFGMVIVLSGIFLVNYNSRPKRNG